MFQVEVDKSKNLLKIRYAQHVGPEDTKAVVEKVSTLLPDLQPGFRLLKDLSGVPEIYGADQRPKKLEWMLRQAKSLSGK